MNLEIYHTHVICTVRYNKWWLMSLMSSGVLEYHGLPKLPILHSCLYLRCLQSSVLLQDIYLSERWSTWHFSSMLRDPVDKSWYWLILISKAVACKAPSSLSDHLWEFCKIIIKFFVGHIASNECCTLSSASLCSSHLGPFPLY